MKPHIWKWSIATTLSFALSASTAHAHKVPANYDDAAWEYLRDEGKADWIGGVAEFCYATAMPPDICISRIGKDLRAAQAAVDCAEAVANHQDFDPTLGHMVSSGRDANGKEDLVYHTTFVTPTNDSDKQQFGEHRHDWSEKKRDDAGFEVAGQRVDTLKEAFDTATRQTSKETSGEVKAGVIAELTAQVKSLLPVAQGELSEKVKAEIEGKMGNAEKEVTTHKGPSDELVKAVWDKGMQDGRTHPEATSVKPDILESKEPNKSFNVPAAPTVQPQAPTAADSKTGCDCNSCSSAQCQASTSTQSKKNIVLTDGPSALEQCQAERYLELRDDLYSTYETTTADQQSLKQRAEASLANGLCMSEWYGEEFCADFTRKFLQTIMPNPADQSFQSETSAEMNQKQLELTMRIEQSPEQMSEFTLALYCANPLLSQSARDEAKCPAETGSSSWCTDPRATPEEKTSLQCPGYYFAPETQTPPEEPARGLL